MRKEGNKMKNGYGCSSEKQQCAFCKKITNDFMEYSEKGIDVKFWCHIDCRKNLTEKVKPLLKLLHQITKDK